MANTIIQLKHSTVTGNVPASLANGEISINNRDGKLFYSTPLGVVTAFNPYPGPSGLDTELQFNDSGVVGSDADLTFNKTTNILSAKNIVVSGNNYFGNSNLHAGITQLTVTHAGSGAYLFDQYSGNNPSIYVGAGETISFNLNVSGHPFLIRESSGGANTSAGLTHISTSGVVSSGADAQGKISGILFWKVPFSLVGATYVYQCQIHGGMVGNIVIQQPASFVAANTTIAFNTANAAFTAANAATATNTTQNNSIAAAFTTANNAAVATDVAAINTTQNNSITAVFSQANTASDTATAAFTKANTASDTATAAFAAANTTTATDITQNNSITAVFSKANTTSDTVTAAFLHANASFIFANTISGGAAIDNVARSQANTAITNAQAAFDAANSAISNTLALSIALG